MADLKITQLGANTTPIGTDLLVLVDDPSGSPADQKITLNDLGIIDGWLPASETWTYASATTITVPSGAASKYQLGDKIKLTQSASVKYFYIVGVADTVLTVTGGSIYTVADATISANYYSHKENPIGFPAYFNFVSTWSSSGTAVSLGSGTVGAIFTIQGKKCHVNLFFTSAGDTTYGTGTYYFTVPVAGNANNIAYSILGSGVTLDSGSGYAGSLIYPLFEGSDRAKVKMYGAATVTNTSPITFASGDQIGLSFDYYI